MRVQAQRKQVDGAQKTRAAAVAGEEGALLQVQAGVFARSVGGARRAAARVSLSLSLYWLGCRRHSISRGYVVPP